MVFAAERQPSECEYSQASPKYLLWLVALAYSSLVPTFPVEPRLGSTERKNSQLKLSWEFVGYEYEMLSKCGHCMPQGPQQVKAQFQWFVSRLIPDTQVYTLWQSRIDLGFPLSYFTLILGCNYFII